MALAVGLSATSQLAFEEMEYEFGGVGSGDGDAVFEKGEAV